MLFYRILGALMVACSGIFAAHSLNAMAKSALEQSEAVISFLRYVRVQVDCFALPIASILSRCEKGLLEKMGHAGENTPETLEELISGCTVCDRETFRIFGQYAEEFGKSYREEQIGICDYYLELLGEHRQKIAAALPPRKKINSALCISSALAVVILLL